MRTAVGLGGPTRDRCARRHTIETGQVQTSLGDLCDVSIAGARVVCPKAPTFGEGATLPIRIQSGGSALSLSARVAWVRRSGGSAGTHEVGLRFIGVGRAEQAVLEHLGQYGFLPAARGGASSRAEVPKAGAPAGSSSANTNASQIATPTTVEIEDLYAILGVHRDATPEQIRSAYHALAHQLHPDAGAGEEAAERFALVSKAYAALRDPRVRERYDAMLAGQRCAA